MVYSEDLKSSAVMACRFESGLGHQVNGEYAPMVGARFCIRISTANQLIGSIPIFPAYSFRSLGVMVAHVESDPDKDTIQQPIHSIHKDEIGVRIPGAPPSFVKVLAREVTLQRLLRRTNVVKGKRFESSALKSVSSKWWTYWIYPK